MGLKVDVDLKVENCTFVSGALSVFNGAGSRVSMDGNFAPGETASVVVEADFRLKFEPDRGLRGASQFLVDSARDVIEWKIEAQHGNFQMCRLLDVPGACAPGQGLRISGYDKCWVEDLHGETTWLLDEDEPVVGG